MEKVLLSGYTPYPEMKNDSRLPHLARKIEARIDKTALGAQKTQAWEKVEDINEAIDSLRAEKYQICALEQSTDSTPLHKFKTPAKVALIIGNEVDGLDKTTLEKTDKTLEIPMYGQKKSYNVIQALAMALFAFRFNAK